MNTKPHRDVGIIQKKDRRGQPVWYARIVRVDGAGRAKQFVRKAASKSEARRLKRELENLHAKRRH